MPSLLVPSVLGSVRTPPVGTPGITSAVDVGTSRPYNNASTVVSYVPPSFDGKLPITSYTITTGTGQSVIDTDGSPATLTGLASNATASLTVKASNALGQTSDSSPFTSNTLTTIPQTVGTVTASRTNDTTVSLSFTNPQTGGKTITSYIVESTPSITLSVSGTSSPLTVTGTFVAGTSYAFKVRAVNANGSGDFSANSNGVVPKTLVVPPGAPTIGIPTVISTTQVDVLFTPPASNGGATITGYVVQSSPSISLTYSSSDTTSPIRVTGSFAVNTEYSFRVAAVNSAGTGTYSAYSDVVMPYYDPNQGGPL